MLKLTEWCAALCWAVFFIYILVSAFSVKRTTEVDRGWKWGWLALTMAIAALIFFFRGAYGISFGVYANEAMLWQRTITIGVIVDVLAIAGLVVALWGRITLGRNWNIVPGLKEDQQLIERGPYAYVRHPMYTGLLLMAFGTIVLFGTALGVIAFVICFLGTWLKLRQEEKMLTNHFGQSYIDYKTRVKALVPFLW